MSTHEFDRRTRATAPDGALSPGSTASTLRSGSRDGYVAQAPPAAHPSPADPEALIRGQRVTTAHDMEDRSAHAADRDDPLRAASTTAAHGQTHERKHHDSLPPE